MDEKLEAIAGRIRAMSDELDAGHAIDPFTLATEARRLEALADDYRKGLHNDDEEAEAVA